MATQAERRASTRTAIVDAARVCFLEAGYHSTSVSDVLQVAGVSRGAMYHHFPSKEDVFAAVYATTSADAVRRSGRAIDSTSSPLDRLLDGCVAWLRTATEADVATILLVEGPVALGWDRCRAIEEATSFNVMRRSIEAAAAAGELDVHDLDSTARLINALLAEAALEVQRDPAPSHQAAVEATVRDMILGFARTR